MVYNHHAISMTLTLMQGHSVDKSKTKKINVELSRQLIKLTLETVIGFNHRVSSSVFIATRQMTAVVCLLLRCCFSFKNALCVRPLGPLSHTKNLKNAFHENVAFVLSINLSDAT